VNKYSNYFFLKYWLKKKKSYSIVLLTFIVEKGLNNTAQFLPQVTIQGLEAMKLHPKTINEASKKSFW